MDTNFIDPKYKLGNIIKTKNGDAVIKKTWRTPNDGWIYTILTKSGLKTITQTNLNKKVKK